MNFIQRSTTLPIVIGNTLEWYDFALYGYFSPLFIKLFYPGLDQATSLIVAFAIFSVGFLARPIGGIIFGHIGDRIGRKNTLIISILVIAVSTACMGLLPTYQSIGYYAGLLLIFLRMLQGIAVGGEFAGSMIYLVEQTPHRNRGYYGSFSTLGATLGLLLASLVASLTTSLVSQEAIGDWFWRVPFLFGILVGLIGLYLRVAMPESPGFLHLKNNNEILTQPLMHAFTRVPFQLVNLIGIMFGSSSLFYFTFYFIPQYLSTLGFSVQTALVANSLCILICILLVPLFGYLSDCYGRKTICILPALIVIIFAYPLLLFIPMVGIYSMFLSQLIFAVIVSALIGTGPAFFSEMFPTQVRYSSFAFAFNIGQAFGGGLAPLFGALILKLENKILFLSMYITFCAFVIFVSVLAAKETHKEALENY